MSDISPAASGQRMLKAVVIGLGLLIVIALLALVWGMVSKLGAPGAASAPRSAGVFALPPGAKILDMQTRPDRLILHLRTPMGEEVDIVDTRDGHLVARIK